jgi:hypothetical protein
MERHLARFGPTLAGGAVGLLLTGLALVVARSHGRLAARLLDEVHRHLLRAIVGACAVVVAAAAFRMIAPGLGRGLRALVTGATTSIVVAGVTSLLVLSVVLVRPAWCPAGLCSRPPSLRPPPQELAADFTATQSAAYVLGRDPAGYRLQDLPGGARPTDVAAVVAADGDAPYAVAITLRVPAGAGLVVDGVELAVVDARLPPAFLRVATVGPTVQYRSNPYRVRYDGQPRGALVPAAYAGTQRLGFVQLQPGQTGELTLLVASPRPVDLKYRLRIAYRAAGETTVRRFEVPILFEVVFSDQRTWQRFQVRDGRLVPA